MGMDIVCAKNQVDSLSSPKAWYVLEPLILKHFGFDKEKDKSKYAYGHGPSFTKEQAFELRIFLIRNLIPCIKLYNKSDYVDNPEDLFRYIRNDFYLFIDFLDNCIGFRVV